MVNLLARFLYRWRWPLFGLAALLTGLAYFPARSITFDRRIDRMFAADDPRYQSYQQLKNWFGDSETSVIGYDDPQLFSVEGMTRLEKLHDQISKIEGIRSVVSLRSVRRQSAPLDGRPFSKQLAAEAISPEDLKAEILASRVYRGRLVAETGITPILWIELASRGDQSVNRARIIGDLRKTCADFDPSAVLAGGPVLVDEVFTNLERDGWTLGVSSSLILTIMIALLFRNIRWILLPLAVVQVTLLWTKAVLVVSGMQLSMVSSPLVALVTVIGVATVVHITVRFREERQKLNTEDSFLATMNHIGPAIFWTCLTTVGGFASLIISQVMPVRDFGIMMSIGAGLVFFSAMLLSAPFITFFPSISNSPGTAIGEQWIATMLQRSVAAMERSPKSVLLVVTLLMVASGLGVSRLQMATDFNENFRKESLIVRSFDFLVQRVEGINALDVLIEIPKESRGRTKLAKSSTPAELSDENGPNESADPSAEAKKSREDFSLTLDRLRKMQRELEGSRLVAQTMSLADLIDFMSPPEKQPAETKEESPLRKLLNNVPDAVSALSDRNKLTLLETIAPELIGRFWNRKEGVTRIIVQGKKARGADEKRELVQGIQQTANRHFPGSTVTGSYVLMVYLTQSLMGDQWISFGISIASILIMLTIAFRSFRLGVIALIPNLAPILLVLGAMGWLEMKINIATAMLASVSLGLSVDFSIHYIGRYQQEIRKGRTFFEAIREVQSSVGLAMILANLALIAGFLVLLLSSLIPTVHFGLLVSVAMLGGLVGNLLILPLLLKFDVRN